MYGDGRADLEDIDIARGLGVFRAQCGAHLHPKAAALLLVVAVADGDAVIIGVGVAVTPASMAGRGIDGVTFVPIEGHGQFSEISLIWHPGRVSPVLARLLASLAVDIARSGNERAR